MDEHITELAKQANNHRIGANYRAKEHKVAATVSATLTATLSAVTGVLTAVAASKLLLGPTGESKTATILSLIATVVAVVNTALALTTRATDHKAAASEFEVLRGDWQLFLHDAKVGADYDAVRSKFNEVYKQRKDIIGRSPLSPEWAKPIAVFLVEKS